MHGTHPARRLTALSLFALVLFATYVAYLWHDSDESGQTWNWESWDSTTIARALGHSVNNADQALACAQEFSPYNRGVLVQITPLLQRDSSEVRAAAADFLNRARANTTADLPVLIAAHRRGVPILPAIAGIGTAEAVDYVASEHSRKGDWFALASDLSSGGPAGALRLAAIYRNSQPVPPELHRSLCDIIHSRSPSGPRDFKIWLEVACDSLPPEANRCAALELLALLGDDSIGALPTLEKMASKAPAEMANSARQTVSRIAGGGTLARLKPELEFELSRHDSPWIAIDTVCAIGRLQTGGRYAGPIIAPLLASPNWDLRTAAATALGRIGYSGAIPALTATIGNQGDWMLAGASAEALARLGGKDAIPALRRVATDHWYQPVRDVAAESIDVISSQTTFAEFRPPLANSGWRRGSALDRHVWIFSRRPPTSSPPLRLARRLSCLIGNTWDRAWLWRANRKAKAVRTRLGRPDYGQAFGEGYLLGYDYGEWGGEIVYVADGRIIRTFPTGNVFGFYPMPFGLVVVASYYNSNEGMIHLLKPDANGTPVCEPLQRLPFDLDPTLHFAPITRRWNRELIIIGEDGQSVVLTRSGTLRMAD